MKTPRQIRRTPRQRKRYPGDESRQAQRTYTYRALDGTVHERLTRAAKEDNRTVASELSMLLDLRTAWMQLSIPEHPLALPLPEVIS